MTVVLLSALSIIGLHEVVDQLLYTFTGKDLNVYFDMLNNRPKLQKALKPVILCTLCMSSIWGTVFYFTYSILVGDYLFGNMHVGWLPSLLAIAGTVEVLERIRS